MSVEAMTWAFSQRIPPVQKIVLLAIANEANSSGENAYPGQSRLAAQCTLSERSIIRHVAWLEERGLLARERRFRGNGTRTSDCYTLRLSDNQRPSANLSPDIGGRDQVTMVSPTNKPIREPVSIDRMVTRGERLHEDWHPPENLWEKAQTFGLSVETLRFETGAFRDHWLASSGANAVKRDWNRAWLNWMREVVRRGGKYRGNGKSRPSKTTQTALDILEEIRHDNGNRKAFIE